MEATKFNAVKMLKEEVRDGDVGTIKCARVSPRGRSAVAVVTTGGHAFLLDFGRMDAGEGNNHCEGEGELSRRLHGLSTFSADTFSLIFFLTSSMQTPMLLNTLVEENASKKKKKKETKAKARKQSSLSSPFSMLYSPSKKKSDSKANDATFDTSGTAIYVVISKYIHIYSASSLKKVGGCESRSAIFLPLTPPLRTSSPF